MKRWLSAWLGMCLVISLVSVGCGKNKKEEETSTAQPSSVQTAASTEETTEAETTTAAEKTGNVTSRLNFRSEPGTDASVLEILEAGTRVTILEELGTWYKVSVNGREGYVASSYITVDEAEESSSTAASESGSQQAESSAGTENAETQTSASKAEPGTTVKGHENGVLSDNGLFDLTGLSNKSIPYGNDWEDKDETGLATGVHYYESLYSKYYPVYRIKTGEKLIYLTMDEGYEAGYTPKILDTLKEKKVKAVFFLTKQFVDENPALVQRMIDEGHILGNHSCAHPSGGFPSYVDEKGLDAFVNDLSTLHKMVYDQFGYDMQLFRFPEGEASELLMAQADNLGYTSVFWSYAHRDYVTTDQPEVSVTLERCLSHMAPGAVYLLHAVSSSNTEALADFIDQARAQGYEFGVFPVDEASQR